MSFYFACSFGLSSVSMLISSDPIGELRIRGPHITAAQLPLPRPSPEAPDYQAMMMPMPMQQKQPKKPGEVFEHEWEALEIVHHDWALDPQEQRDDVTLTPNTLAAVELALVKRWDAGGGTSK
jgi:hypothetical protein